MANIVVLGAGLAGMSAAYELRDRLGKSHPITVIGDGERFSFTPSNPWLAVGWRQADDFTFPVGEYLAKKGIEFVPHRATRIDAMGNRVETSDGRVLDYDYLLI